MTLFDGCCLDRETETVVRQAGFSKVHEYFDLFNFRRYFYPNVLSNQVEVVNYKTDSLMLWVINSQLYGWATK